MRIPSAKVDQYIYFVAVDATDLVTRETGLATWTVYRSRKGAAEVAYTTPTITEIDATNMPGVYALLVDEDTTIDSGSDSEEYAVHITHAGMAPVTRTIELYRRDTTSGQTIDVASGGVEVGSFQAGAITAASIATDAIDADAIADNAINAAAIATGAITAAKFAAGAIDAAAIAADAITAAKIADGAIDANTFAAGAITAAAIAADAIGASELAADAVAEIADAVWDEDATGHQTQGTFGQAIGDPVADTNTIFKAVVTDAAGATVGVDVVAVQADTDNIQTRIPAALVSGRIDASVGAMAADVVTASAVADGAIDAGAIAADAITAAKIAAGAIDADALAADAGTEIGTAVWASVARTLTALDEDSTTLDLDATIRAAVGLASANLDTQIGDLPTNAELATALGTADDAVLAAVALVQADTDNIQTRLPAALVSGRIDASVGAMATDTLTAAALAADAVAEIQSGLSTLTAAGVRSAVGLASANLDTQLDALPTNSELTTALAGADDATLASIAALSIPTANQNADALLDRTAGIETGLTPRQGLRLMAAALLGEASGMETDTATFRDVNDTTNRIVATVDEFGNRSSVTLNPA